ncbi:Veg family protein [Candidatus Hakubella thermalkaliphila]|uniref:Veg protein n=1 Tax=Candidatus Hakubella thermalkaliphila TaxID=2754717 RepID=A0A6V8P4U6_9ACTN|nr:Veg family protein [Candidatus Hakubella thermalkaliphila]GFP26880.1 hypothetical protein HKBW3S33_00294 [Candidatus Hakubella thermalkaliphila]
MPVVNGPHVDVIDRIKGDLSKMVGQRVKMRANKGRKVIVEKEGTIEEVYPNLFVMRLNEAANRSSRVSYSYVDILTKTVQLSYFSTGENALPWLSKLN